MYRLLIGIYNRCKKIYKSVGGDLELNCYIYIKNFMDIFLVVW